MVFKGLSLNSDSFSFLSTAILDDLSSYLHCSLILLVHSLFMWCSFLNQIWCELYLSNFHSLLKVLSISISTYQFLSKVIEFLVYLIDPSLFDFKFDSSIILSILANKNFLLIINPSFSVFVVYSYEYWCQTIWMC